MSKPEIDWDEIFGAASRWADGLRLGDDALDAIITRLVNEAYEAGRQDVLHETGRVRAAMLVEQAVYLDEASKAISPSYRAVSLVIADAFNCAAEKYRANQRPTLDPSVGLCGSSEAHDKHRFDEDYVDGKLASWRTCQGISPS